MHDDIHATTAKAIFEIKDAFDSEGNLIGPKQMYKMGLITTQQRYTGKKTNHATSYKMGPYEFTRNYNEEADVPINNSTAKKYQEAWHSLYPRIRGGWWPNIEWALRTNNSTLVTPYGRRVTFFGPIDSYIKEATAFEPQSTVADHFRGREQRINPIAGGLRKIRKDLPREARLIQQGHDSALVECPREVGLDVAYIMKNALFRPIVVRGEEVWIPVDGEIGEDWGNLEKIKWS
jgi:DNA polymerase I-like protein with 3'-5' exonuclease and polymerase domains